MVKAIQTALESDPGIVYGLPRSIDGIKAIKAGKSFDFTYQITLCTKSEWPSRIKSFKSIFGKVPEVIEQNISTLERIRKLRNDVAHSFGRDIEDSHIIHDLNILEMSPLTQRTLLKYWDLIDSCVRGLDEQLYKENIGEYQLLCFYNANEDDVIKNANSPTLGNKARAFRKIYGHKDKNGPATLGQEFAKGLISYYDSI